MPNFTDTSVDDSCDHEHAALVASNGWYCNDLEEATVVAGQDNLSPSCMKMCPDIPVSWHGTMSDNRGLRT